ncbi:tetratricopeptide repeat protein [Peteryoungia algae]|uniref:Tetratricopeptide repeat protein n=1 Tax=Peteryoungia algae TaxID=2919917 RepID=A0ABT0CX80_9HYPH|nr:tetratricopeptide repeat protein [Rhizobium sp. SSM4.3]MCJ8237769.1 tetratricopeptide repeat protein [Rhizobium sp. SSM4.3]
MTDADIVAVSTGREEEFGRIIAAVSRSRSATPGALQHVVLYGSRGFGKSFMMRRVEIALQRTPTDNKPITFLLLPEEQHNLQKSPHAFLDYITVLLTKTEGDEAFAEAMFQWPKPDEAARRWKESAAKLEAALDVALPDGKGLVIVAVENFDSLLKTLFANDEDEQRLRDWLFRQKNRVMLLATATGTVDMDYDKPLFQAFESVRLQPWTTDDCITYFNRKRESEGKSPLNGRQEAKARAVAEFIGGTPRLAQLLAEVIETEDALTVAETMNALADRLAEYYRRRIEDLAPLVRGLLDALIRGGEPASQTQLAERVGAEGQSQIARAMTDLQRADIIRGRPAPDSRETLYAVTDRVFAHYYRRRQGSRVAHETPLASILDFLRSFYDRQEQKQQGLRHLLDGRLAEGALFSRLAMEQVAGEKSDYITGFKRGLMAWFSATTADLGSPEDWETRLAQEPENVLHECRPSPGMTLIEATILTCLRAHALYRLGHERETEGELNHALDQSKNDIAARVIALDGLMRFLSLVRDDQEAVAQLGMSLDAEKLDTLPSQLRCLAYRMLGWSLEYLNHHEEALVPLKQAIEFASEIGNKREETIARRLAGLSLGQLDRIEEALSQLYRAIDLAQEIHYKYGEATARRYAGWFLGKLARHDEAIVQLSQAIALAVEIGDKIEEEEARQYAGWSLGQLRRHEEALPQLRQAIELARESGDDLNLCWSTCYACTSATCVPMPGIIGLFIEWVLKFQETSSDLFPDPRSETAEVLIAAMRSGEWLDFDELIAEHGEWLASEKPVFFYREHGKILADIAVEGGRSAGWQAAAGVLPRAALLQAFAPEDLQDKSWLSDLMTGFAETCRDPGLLRDVASLLTPKLSPESAQSAALLMDLANVDEADDPERLLARIDPDRALLIRRLRDLPDPELPRPPGAARRKRL